MNEPDAQQTLQGTERASSEHVKALRCLYEVATLTRRSDVAAETIYHEVLARLIDAYGTPTEVGARLTIDDRTYRAGPFAETLWRQEADIRAGGRCRGTLEIASRTPRPGTPDGAFTAEERELVAVVALLLGGGMQEHAALLADKERLRREKVFSEQLLDSSVDVVYAIDHAGRCRLWNRAAERVTGLSREQVLGREVAVHPFLLAMDAQEGLRRALAGDYTLARERTYPILTFGVEGVFDVYYTPLRGPTGAVEGALGIGHDITRHKRAEQALQRSEQLLRTVLDHLPVGVLLFDREGTVVAANPAVERIWGEDRDRPRQYQGWWTESGEPVEPQGWGWVRALERGEAALDEVIDIEGRDAVRRTVLASAVPMRDAEERITGAVAVFQDISALKRTERELWELNARLTRSLAELVATQQQVIQSEKLAALGTLAAGVAHELNNPLMGVMGCVTFARKAAREPQVQELLDNANRELERMRDLIRNMLDFARPVVDVGTLRAVSVPAVLERTLSLMRPELKMRDITVTVDIPRDLPSVQAKEDRLQQVLVNLLLNARDAVEGRPRRLIRVRAYRREETVGVEVSDSGPGVAPDIQGRIFDPFFSTKPIGKGTGLGLPIARNIVADMGGSLTYRGCEGQGAIFVLELPSRRTDAG